MDQRIRRRLRIEVAIASGAAALGVLTVFWRDWIEVVFHVDPDRHSGALEWGIVAVLFAVSLVFGLIAHRERLRARVAD